MDQVKTLTVPAGRSANGAPRGAGITPLAHSLPIANVTSAPRQHALLPR